MSTENAEKAFTFYKSVLGGAFAKMMRYKDLSSPEYPEEKLRCP
jgi:PhnB protein